MQRKIAIVILVLAFVGIIVVPSILEPQAMLKTVELFVAVVALIAVILAVAWALSILLPPARK